MAKNRKSRAVQVNSQTVQAAAPVSMREYHSAGRYSTVDENGRVNHNMASLSGVSAARAANRQAKMAGIFADGDLGPANIADSNNIGYYSYQFPVDAMEMPASRAEELEFYRLAITRDPIVSRGIDMHCEIPLSKMKLEKPKCSVESFSDYVFDYFQRLMNDTRLFSTLIKATREYQVIGEAFMFVEQPENYMENVLCKAASEALKRGRGYQAGVSPMSEAENGPLVGQEREILPDFINQRRKQSSKVAKIKGQKLAEELAQVDATFDENEDPDDVHRSIVRHKAKLAKLTSLHEARQVAIRMVAEKVVEETLKRADLAKEAIAKTAAPGDAAPAPDAGAEPAPDAAAPDAGGDLPGGEGGDPSVDDGGGDLGMDAGMPMGGGGGGGLGGGPSIPNDMVDAASSAIQTADDAKRAREINELQRYIHLLERKKTLLEELEELTEKRKLEDEIFGHVVNEDFEGFDRIQLLQPERITIDPSGGGDEPAIMYKPSEAEKATYLNDPDVPNSVKDQLESEGVIELPRNPFQGSYVIHFARKQSGYEEHGRSALQPCIRSIIYREKLRQVQTTLASRNMTPKTLITAPGVSEVQVAQLRAHADEAKADPDYTIVTNYEVTWNEIDAQSRLLSLADEWQHTNSNLAIGLGFSPELLIGEGMYGGNRTQLQLLETTYVQFREELSDIVENQLFRPIAMLKGFFETDNYGKPRWIFPKITFGQLALRDSSDLLEFAFNMYSKGSLPVETIYELMGVDSETVTRQLEDALFTVKDSKYNELLSSMYGSLGGEMINRTDVLKRIAKGMKLNEEQPDASQMEGSGEG
jgi:hypothetical protein